jgi:hypothetical protein
VEQTRSSRPPRRSNRARHTRSRSWDGRLRLAIDRSASATP